MLKFHPPALQSMRLKAKDNPAVIVRNSVCNMSYDVIFKYLRNNDILIYCVSWEDAIDAIQQINQETIE